MSSFLLSYIGARELGRQNKLVWKENLFSTMYAAVKPTRTTESIPYDGLDWGAVFGFGFSPDGTLLAAACENKCMLLYDPHNARLINRRFKTHTDCVNCVRFLDDRTFATCSDDKTIRLWDSRFLTQEIRILKGHTNWVKSIEYCSSKGKLITSGFDGNVVTWDINNYSENERPHVVFHAKGIMRTKVTPDEKKMIISTLSGYFVLIHDLNLTTLREDLQEFEHFYQAAHLLNKNVLHTFNHNHIFTRKRNRVEIVSDFPEDDNAESISTMQVHPHGWCIASRNTTFDEETEWTCIHDIQTLEKEQKTESDKEKCDSERSLNCQTHGERLYLNSHPFFGDILHNLWRMENVESNDTSSQDEQSDEDDGDILSERSSSHNVTDTSSDEFSNTPSHARMQVNNTFAENSRFNRTVRHALENSFVNLLNDRLMSSTPGERQSSNHAASEQLSQSSAINDRSVAPPQASPALDENRSEEEVAVRHYHNFPGSQRAQSHTTRLNRRLLFYSEEPNVGRGFIKEQSFSCDGKVLASPFANSVRLLGFNYSCSELCDIVPKKPKLLCQVAMTVAQKSSILASTFSPVHCMFVAGARDGSISFCCPRF